jgi:hypothetical protein
MPKQERNKQFICNEEKIRTDLLVRGKSTEKTQVHFDEFEEIKKILEMEFSNLNLSLSEGIRWLYLRWLSFNKKIPVEIEKRHPEYLTDADLESNGLKWKTLKGKDNGYLVWLKVFGTDFQKSILNKEEKQHGTHLN